MNQIEAKEYLKLIDSVFKGGNLTENKLAKEEYLKVLGTIDMDLMQQVFDDLAKKYKFFPSISEIYEVYNEIKTEKREREKIIQPDTTCYSCENRGFVIYKNQYNCEYVLYCTECDKGKEYAYQGKNNSQRYNAKTDYFVEPVTKYFDIEELNAKNMFKNHNIVSCPTELKQQLRKIGARL